MKLLNYTSAYFAVILLIVISGWAGVFYYSMLDEIYDSIDDGLDNQKGLVIQKAALDTTVLRKNDFEESDYAILEVPAADAVNFQDTYVDTMMYMQNEKSDEPVRLLRTVFLQGGKYYRLQIATSMVEEDDLIKQLFYSVLWLYLGLVVTIIIFNNFLLKTIWNPFYQLLKQLKKFRLDKPEPIKPVKTSVDEFQLLHETVDRFIRRNLETYNNQKDFIENASHELQTPLAVSINKLEALAENNDLPESQMQLLASAMDNLERLTRLNKSLLLLSKIENKQFAHTSLVDFNELTRKLVVDFSDQLTYSQLSTTVIEKETCQQQMNDDLAGILVTNLVKNAIVHNHPGGVITITIRKGSFEVSNSGDHQPLDKEKIFNRFHKELSSQKSTGLGLAIVKAIADLYHFRVEYYYDQQHIIRIYFS